MKDVCDTFEFNHLAKYPTCFKSSIPLCIGNFYTNKKATFFNSSTVETRIYDHYSLICKIWFVKAQQNLHATGLITTIIKNNSK